MAKRRKKPDDSDHVARDGALVLTFVNTGSRRSRRLEDYTDLLAWANRYGVLPPAESRRLGELAAERPAPGFDSVLFWPKESGRRRAAGGERPEESDR